LLPHPGSQNLTTKRRDDLATYTSRATVGCWSVGRWSVGCLLPHPGSQNLTTKRRDDLATYTSRRDDLATYTSPANALLYNLQPLLYLPRR